MKLVVISPEQANPHEAAVLSELLEAGLERYHVRKPKWRREEMESWLRGLPEFFRPRLVLHRHHELVAKLGLGGRHWRDDSSAGRRPAPGETRGQPDDGGGYCSRSCHELNTLRAALGRYDAVLFGPIFPSLSKPGYGPKPTTDVGELSELLHDRSARLHRTSVFALGGVCVRNLSQVAALGFDGAAVLGAVWQSADPARAFRELKSACLLEQWQRWSDRHRTAAINTHASTHENANDLGKRPAFSTRRLAK